MRRFTLISALLFTVTACGPESFDSFDSPVAEDVLLIEADSIPNEGDEETGGAGMGGDELPPPDMPAEDPAGWCCDCEALKAGGWGCEPSDSVDECIGDSFVWCIDDEGNPTDCISMC